MFMAEDKSNNAQTISAHVCHSPKQDCGNRHGAAGSGGRTGSRVQQRVKVLARYRPGKQVSLAVVASGAGEQIALFIRLYAFRDHLDVQLVRHHDDRLAQRHVVGVGNQVANEALVDYGAVKGDYADDNNRVLFWTEKGLCAGLPFENLTEQQLRVAPGFEASVAVIEKYGDKKAVVSLALP
jgi:hypothetical protein